MPTHIPANLTEVSHSISIRTPFHSRHGLAGESIWVLSYGAQMKALTGQLAERVQNSARDYTDRYMALGGGRKRRESDVFYYVTRNTRTVVGYITVEGHIEVDASQLTPGQYTAVRRGLESIRITSDIITGE